MPEFPSQAIDRSTDINLGAQLLSAGSLIIFPTETVYGLGADAQNENAVRTIFRAKKRPPNHPLIVHIGDIRELEDWAVNISTAAYQCAESFWPGPLTLVLNKHPAISSIVTGGQETIALRMPKHPVARHLLQIFGSGIAAPSANLFTHLSPTNTAVIDPELLADVDLVLEGGDCEVGLESTILDMSDAHLRMLRPGMIDVDSIEAVLKQRIETQVTEASARAPGMHRVHYAPKTLTRLISSTELAALTPPEKRTGLLLHSALGFKFPIATVNLPAEPAAYAQRLYRSLHELDHAGFEQILIECVPEHRAWDAVRDRITKASAR